MASTRSRARRPKRDPTTARPRSARIWMMAARVRTLPAAIGPVLVGTALAGYLHVFHPLRFLAALVGAIFIQVGTNLSNDYSDARRGADTEDRLGPVRITAGGLVPPRQVLLATYLSFGVAVLAGVYLIAVAGWQLLLVGAASILAGVLYTGGPRPYGYEGLGELFVFLFFGIVAVAGSFFVQVTHLDWEAFALAVPVGLIAAGILMVNNIRDIETDRRAHKRTIAVRLGRSGARALFAVTIYAAYVLLVITWARGPLSPLVMLPWLTLPVGAEIVRVVRNRVDGPSLNRALAQTGLLQLAFCMLLSAGVLFS
jgi:1,4-dihydroxy-2-naphthoate octaprenyltransferase